MRLEAQSPDSEIPGITPQMWERFQHGDCWLLADRVRRATGWPVLVAVDERDPQGPPMDHAVVETPRGLLDISGLHRPERFLEIADMNGRQDRDDPEFQAMLREQSRDPGWRYAEPCPPELLDAAVRLLIDYAR